MKSSFKLFLYIFLGLAVVLPLFFFAGHYFGAFIGELIADGKIYQFVIAIVISIGIIVFINKAVQSYLKRKDAAKTPSEEERMLQPFFDATLEDKKNVLASFSLLGLLTLIIVGLIVNQFTFFMRSAIFWLFVFIYFLLITLYALLLFEKTRKAYKRNISRLLPVAMSFGGLLGAAVILWANLEITFSYTGMGLTAASFAILIMGVRYFLLANRSIFDKKAKAEEELSFASEVQEQFLLDKEIETENIRGFGMSNPARQVGGDFFILSVADGGRVIAANGDVSGHSFGAGLIMSMLHTSFEDHVMFKRDFSELFQNLNLRLINQPKRSMFASLGCLIIDGHKATYWNAGHMPILHYKKEEKYIHMVSNKAPALGLSKHSVFKPITFNLELGDLLLIYSDGVVETRDSENNIRDLEFFINLTHGVFDKHKNPEDTLKLLMKKVLEADQSKEPEDDMTLVIVEKK